MTSASPRERSAHPSLLTAAARVFDLSIGQMLWSRRTVFLVLVAAGPVALALVARLARESGIGGGRWLDGTTVFGVMVWLLFVRFIVPVLGVFYGTALVADEVEDKTLTYLFVRPVRRGAVLMGKYAAYLVCTTLIVLPSVMLVYFLVVPLGEVPGSFPWLLADLGILALGLAVYGALFALVGAVFTRPLVTGLVFAFGWEQLAMLLPGSLRQVTIAHYLQALVPHTMPSDGVVPLLQGAFRDVPDPRVSLACLGAFLVAALVLAARAVERREYVLEQ